ncbi:hypothetical protein LPJ66_004751 [Kickxella alabastrina]|uniref:Uncharacterized protein n=1 Tax=Kickxella alabastrina TaxID=61397 RepID=A0ACC1IIT5_9FUNG|nr:hypothetical protein LPJ66_004751 [Kickxella alabastrina]
MNSVKGIRDACVVKTQRGTAGKGLMRREYIPALALTFAALCCLLLMSTCHQGAFFGQQDGTDAIEPDLPIHGDKLHANAAGSGQAQCGNIAADCEYIYDSGDDYHQQKDDLNSSRNANSTDNKTNYIEVIDRNYSPKSDAMPSWLPKKPNCKVLDNSNLVRMSNESRMILANNRDVALHTLEPDQDSLLILTPVKNNAEHLARYFALVDKINYPRDKISIALLVSDSTDRTQQMLIESRQWYQEKAPIEMRFKRFDIYRQDFFYALPRNQRHLREKQRERRIMMARARNYLWTRALMNEQWVLWIDGDLDYYPPNIVRDLMAYNKDVIVPNCLVRRKNNNRWKHSVYDRNAWQETPKSLAMIKTLKEDDFLVEGYKTLKTYRKYLDNFTKNQTIVPLDGVGGTFTLVKAHVHRSGVGFPAWLFQHQVETEGFAKLAKAHGYGVFGLPYYYIRHVVG